MHISITLIAAFIYQTNAKASETYQPSLPPELIANATPVANFGIGGESLSPLPPGLSLNVPPAKDALAILSDQSQNASVLQIKVAASQNYQTRDMKNGVSISPYKTRSEISMIGLPLSAYGEGNDRAYRIAIRLDASWIPDQSVAIFTQFKRDSAGPDMFLGVKRQSVVLRIGRSLAANDLQVLIFSNIAKAQWAEIILAVHWSTSGTGRVSVFYRYGDEASYLRLPDIIGPNLQSTSSGTYIKFGIYKPENFPSQVPPKTQQILDIGNISIFSLKGRVPANSISQRASKP